MARSYGALPERRSPALSAAGDEQSRGRHRVVVMCVAIAGVVALGGSFGMAGTRWGAWQSVAMSLRSAGSAAGIVVAGSTGGRDGRRRRRRWDRFNRRAGRE